MKKRWLIWFEWTETTIEKISHIAVHLHHICIRYTSRVWMKAARACHIKIHEEIEKLQQIIFLELLCYDVCSDSIVVQAKSARKTFSSYVISSDSSSDIIESVKITWMSLVVLFKVELHSVEIKKISEIVSFSVSFVSSISRQFLRDEADVTD